MVDEPKAEQSIGPLRRVVMCQGALFVGAVLAVPVVLLDRQPTAFTWGWIAGLGVAWLVALVLSRGT